MSTYILKKVNLQNFKIFSYAPVNFDGKDISVLDGPNGYGKTTIFDAIEYALTGNILRITEEMPTDGKLAFPAHFLAHKPGDICVEAFLTDGINDIVIQRRIENVKGKENNPNQLVANTRTTIIVGEEQFEYENVQSANKKLSEYINNNVQKHFRRYYYLSQENRLDFLSKSETERMKGLNYIFQMEKEQLEKDKANRASKKFTDIANKLKTKELALNEDLLKLQSVPKLYSDENIIPYHTLAIGIISPSWDYEHPTISNLDALKDMQKQLHNISLFTRQFNWFLQQKQNIWIEQQIKSPDELKQNLFLQSIQPESLEFFFEIANKYKEVQQIIKIFKLNTHEPDYEGLNLQRLSELLDIQYSAEEVSVCKDKISDCRKGMQAQEKARANLITLRKQLENQRQNWLQNKYSGLKENECPFCGRPWDSREQLDEHIQIITEVINAGSSLLVEQLNQSQNGLQGIIIEIFIPVIQDFLKDKQYLEIDLLQQILSDKTKAVQQMKDFCSKAAGYGIQLEKNILTLDNIEKWDSIYEVFCSQQLRPHQRELPAGFLENASECEFGHIFEVTFLGNEEIIKNLPIIREDTEKQKAAYLEQQYYLQQEKRADEIKRKLKDLNQQQDKAVKIQQQFDQLQKKITKAIQDYEKKIAQQLQIPFFLFSGRILQNYPGGLGVCLKTKGTNSIHFDASNRQGHDIIYTMSSGQLSGISIALMLTLNRIYAENSFRCVLIDDPIQTMDELNITSFVDLLRNDFPEYQFIISTHEEEFSDYMRYKFDNYNRSHQSIDVRTLDQI